MIEVTKEMLAAGEIAWAECKGISLLDVLVLSYRAMRALEPKEIIPEAAEVLGNNAQMPAKEIDPKDRNRQWTPPVLRAEDQAKPPGWDTAGYPKETPWYDRRTVAQAHARIDIIVPIIRELSGFFKGTERGDRLQILLQQLERAMERAIAPPTGGS